MRTVSTDGRFFAGVIPDAAGRSVGTLVSPFVGREDTAAAHPGRFAGGHGEQTSKGSGDVVVGPVQLLMIGFKGDQVPPDVRREVKELLVSHQIRVLDVLTILMHRNRTIERQPGPDLLPPAPTHSGDLIDRLLRESGAAAVMGDSTSGGRGYLFSGDNIPQLRNTMKAGTGAIVLLLEHLWATALRDAVVNSEAFPVSDAWVGRTALQRLDLLDPTQ
ncbi:hypothetical protein O7630_03115 [Micromonospora sp. WMMD718]|uniref:hypothetical protein n=1 Tax=Micromonospora sp. WMMD718 TaxID=3016098 RepID=UPI002415FDB6|nr:hypothetical protein [Micromonospora sp. WMMD718]MDG4749923.1 hypothetical protein [Micromonospora sp. WMMD718]